MPQFEKMRSKRNFDFSTVYIQEKNHNQLTIRLYAFNDEPICSFQSNLQEANIFKLNSSLIFDYSYHEYIIPFRRHVTFIMRSSPSDAMAKHGIEVMPELQYNAQP